MWGAIFSVKQLTFQFTMPITQTKAFLKEPDCHLITVHPLVTQHRAEFENC